MTNSNIYICENLGCTYALDLGSVLMYHPIYANGNIEKVTSKYDYVEWDCLDDDAIEEAEKALKTLTTI